MSAAQCTALVAPLLVEFNQVGRVLYCTKKNVHRPSRLHCITLLHHTNQIVESFMIRSSIIMIPNNTTIVYTTNMHNHTLIHVPPLHHYIRTLNLHVIKPSKHQQQQIQFSQQHQLSLHSDQKQQFPGYGCPQTHRQSCSQTCAR